LRILHINSYYFSSHFYKNLFEKQIDSGLLIDVFVPVSNDKKNLDFDYGSYTTISNNHNKFDRIFFHLKHEKIFRDIIKKYDINQYSLVHAHSLFSNGYIALRLKEKYDRPFVVAVRNTDVNTFFKKMIHLRPLGIKILEEADRIIFLSKAYRDMTFDLYIPKHLHESLLKKVSVIPNGIDDFWFENIGSPKELTNPQKIRLLHVGDINKNKNIETTVKSVEILNNNGFDVKLDVVGRIKDRRIYKKIRGLNYVNYLGYKTKEELIEIYRNNDIFVLPSINETFGLVYAEAISQGLPVLYTKGQGFDGQFEDGEVGYRVNCFDPNEIAFMVAEISKKKGLINDNCIANAKYFNWSIIVSLYIRIYEDIVND
jgi:glycosyltransferase involved in cell wall biosynthesis